MTQKLISLFRSGMDTLQIAKHLGKPEAWVYAALHSERCIEAGDTTHDDYVEQRRSNDREFREKHRDYQRGWARKQRAKNNPSVKPVRVLVPFAGKEERV